jgi:hypothetical protein
VTNTDFPVAEDSPFATLLPLSDSPGRVHSFFTLAQSRDLN